MNSDLTCHAMRQQVCEAQSQLCAGGRMSFQIAMSWIGRRAQRILKGQAVVGLLHECGELAHVWQAVLVGRAVPSMCRQHVLVVLQRLHDRYMLVKGGC